MVSSGESIIFNFWLYEMQMHDLSFEQPAMANSYNYILTYP